MYSIVSSSNSDSFKFFLSKLAFFYFFLLSDCCGWILIPCWIKVVRVSIFCLIPDLRGNALSSSAIEYNVSYGLVIYGIYVEVCSFITHIVESFYHKRMLNFLRYFFCIHWDDHMIFILQFVNSVYPTDWFVEIELSLHPLDKFTLIVIYNSFNILLNLIF